MVAPLFEDMSCDDSKSVDFSFSEHLTSIERNENPDLYFAFHGLTIATLEAKCNASCGSQNKSCCCDCTGTCGAVIQIKDTYDFCSSFDPNKGGSGNSLARCGCILEDFRKSQGKSDGTFKVTCSVGHKTGLNLTGHFCAP